jgi:hypothetical protein
VNVRQYFTVNLCLSHKILIVDESYQSFKVALELAAKAYKRKYTIAEIPTI